MLRRLLLLGSVAAFGLLALAAAFVAYSSSRPPLPAEEIRVRVVRVGLAESRWRRDVVVAFALPDGSIRENVIPARRFSCRVGDSVGALRQGVAVVLKAEECARRASPAA